MSKTARNKTNQAWEDRDHPSGPEEGPPLSEAGKDRKQYNIEIYEAWCKACGICIAFCPKKCLRLDEEGMTEVTNPERCIGCGWCEVHCPDFAISIREKKDKGITDQGEANGERPVA